jgi:hypothetical protein
VLNTIATAALGEAADRPPAVFVHGVLSWGTDDEYGSAPNDRSPRTGGCC